MIRITPDTNVLVSALFYDGKERALLQAAIDGRVRLVLSADIIDELTGVLDRKFKVDRDMTRDYVFRLAELADIVEPRKLPDLSVRDRADAKIIECAYSGDSDYIVTGDRDLLSFKQYERINIISASALLKMLRRRKPAR